ncbi:site-specific integrase [Shewanella gelidimarina]|uniref:tyrosine-type recombinase/integrase n=1 Tax=Shewanella gelidimarina TaxID=56813 RepID=UPI0020108048|nr:site-specific integrase [Shewanella gelidimarina]MCL1056821.1 site-specific integrase [Shewanella gelidimarina]
MAENKLTAAKINKLRKEVKAKAQTFADGLGLTLRVTPSSKDEASALWLFRYRVGDRTTSPKQLALGKYPDLSIAEARKKRDRCRQWLAEGKDPAIELKLGEAKTLMPISLWDAVNYWIDNYALDARKNALLNKQQLDKWLPIDVKSLPVNRLEKHNLLQIFPKEAVKKYPVAAYTVLSNLKLVLKYCAKRGYVRANNELFEIDIDIIGGQKAQSRDRTLIRDGNWQELIELVKWIKSEQCLPYYCNLLRLLYTFGCRTGEARLSKISEWNLESRLWTVPKDNSKTKSEIRRAIPDVLLPWITSLIEVSELSGSEYILGELKSDKAVSVWGGSLHKKLGHQQRWCLHDIRRTVATGLADLGVMPHVIESQLGHMLKGVAGIYNRSDYLPEKDAAMVLWLNRLELLINDDDNVSILPRATDLTRVRQS